MSKTKQGNENHKITESLIPLSIPIGAVSLDPRNARTHPDKNLEAIKRSIQTYGQRKPIVVNKATNIIEAGNGLWQAAHALGWTHIAAVMVEDSDQSATGFAIMDNQSAALAEWDYPVLKDLLQELDNGAFDMDLTGFDTKAIEDLMTQLHEPGEGLTEDDAIPDTVEPVCKKGDLWQLGNHRLLCGDSTVITDVERLMAGEKADMVFTDPPYDMDMGGQGCWAQSTRNVKKRIDKIIHFDPMVISYLPSLGIPTNYICTSKDGIPAYLRIFEGFNFNILVWCKTNPTPFTAGTFLPDIEYILFFSTKGKIWNNSLQPTEVYKKYYISKKEFGRQDAGDLHPTMKPVGLITNRVMISSHLGGIVLDLFMGSGSTLIACEKLNRRCYGMELDPHYCDVIIKRWEDYTGKKATLQGGLDGL